VKSMTGYGSAEYRDSNYHISVDIKSYNNRYCDIYIKSPAYLSPLEQRINKIVSGYVKRGKVELYINILELSEEFNIILDENLVKGYVKTLHNLINLAGTNEKIRLSHLLRMDGIFKTEKSRDVDYIWEFLKPPLCKALKDFDESRITEGTATEDNINYLISLVDRDVSLIETYVPRIEEKIKETINERFKEVIDSEVELDNSRILSETALLLVKFDINEEIIRMKTHIKHFNEIVKNEVVVGKKLDFVCQELNREINTIGSKNILVELDKLVISVKDSLEKIREQIRNVE